MDLVWPWYTSSKNPKIETERCLGRSKLWEWEELCGTIFSQILVVTSLLIVVQPTSRAINHLEYCLRSYSHLMDTWADSDCIHQIVLAAGQSHPDDSYVHATCPRSARALAQAHPTMSCIHLVYYQECNYYPYHFRSYHSLEASSSPWGP